MQHKSRLGINTEASWGKKGHAYKVEIQLWQHQLLRRHFFDAVCPGVFEI
jgi:hypothetical protein